MDTGERVQLVSIDALPHTDAKAEVNSLAGRHFVLQSDRPDNLAPVDLAEVDPSLRTLLFTDGTVTRTLEAQTLSPVSVEIVAQGQAAVSGEIAGHLGVAKGTPAVRRRVRIGAGQPSATVIWAESHIIPSRLPGDFLEVLGDASDGIGESLQLVQLESWREMLWFGFDRVPEWSDIDTPAKPAAITRLYRVISQRRPALLISETFTVRRDAGMYHLGSVDRQIEPNSSSMS